MRLFAAHAQTLAAERRTAARTLVDCPARLLMPSGYRYGQLANISELGARMELTLPPARGVTVLLQWGAHEVFCKVAWVQDKACGLAFESPLPAHVMEDITGETAPPAGPVAKHGNIPLGMKRGLRPAPSS